MPVAALGMAIAAGREKSVMAEIAVAAAFSLVAVPVCLAAGHTAETGVAIAAVFGGVFITATLAVRGIIATRRGGGDTAAARRLRGGVLLLAAGALGALAVAATRALLPWIALMAAAPGLGLSAALAIVPPSPVQLRAVGWTLVATSVAAALILALGLSTSP